MSDLWLGFERDDLRDWYELAGLVNVIVDCTGESCESGHTSPASGSVVKPDVGNPRRVPASSSPPARKRSAAHDTVQASYAAQALSTSGCGCGSGGDSSCCSPGVVSLEDVGKVDWNSNYSPRNDRDPGRGGGDIARLRQSDRHGGSAPGRDRARYRLRRRHRRFHRCPARRSDRLVYRRRYDPRHAPARPRGRQKGRVRQRASSAMATPKNCRSRTARWM